MSNVLAALFGGLGAGASSYGTQRIREQDQERLAAQRMAELQQQEQTRLAQTREAALLRQQQLKEEGEQAAIIARTLGIELPPGARLNTQGVQVLAQDAANKRNAAAQAAATERTGMTTQAAMDRMQAQISANKGLNDARIQQLLASANAGNARAMELLARGQTQGNQPPVDTRKPMPVSVAKDIGDVADVAALIRDAKESMATPAAKGAVGWKYNLANIVTPASLEGRVQSMIDGGEGDAVRARLGNLWSTIGKLRSGGAITDSEFKRLEPFLPSPGDDYTKANTKLAELERAYNDILQRKTDLYGGTYKVPDPQQIMGGQRMSAPASSGAPRAIPPRRAGETVQQYRARIGGV